jgi:hypothetical protein
VWEESAFKIYQRRRRKMKQEDRIKMAFNGIDCTLEPLEPFDIGCEEIKEESLIKRNPDFERFYRSG